MAEDLHHFSKQLCVVKQILMPFVQQSTQEEFKRIKEIFNREAASLVEGSSENDQISDVYSYFEIDKQFYWVREWVEGQALAQWQYPLEQGLMAEILHQTLLVLDYLHSWRVLASESEAKQYHLGK